VTVVFDGGVADWALLVLAAVMVGIGIYGFTR